MLAVYTYSDASGIQRNAESDQFNFVGTWSLTGTYLSATLDTVNYGNSQFTCIINNYGSNPTNSMTWSPLVLRLPATGTDASQSLAAQALAVANEAFSIAVIGTNVGTIAYSLASSGSNVAIEALSIAMAGTNSLGTVVPLPVAKGGTGNSTALTKGSVVIVGNSGTYTEDHANLYWDSAVHHLGIGTNSTPNALQVAGSVGLTGNVSNTTGQLGMVMTGDQYGGSALYLRNRDGANGVIFDCTAGNYPICDMVFQTTFPTHANVRLEQRVNSSLVPDNDPTNNGEGEIQFMFDSGYTKPCAVGLYGASFPNVVLNATDTPTNPVAGQIYFDGIHFQGYDGSIWHQLD